MTKEQKGLPAGQGNKKLLVSIILLVVLHLVGSVGLLCKYDLFLQITPINLLLSAILLFINHKKFNIAFYIFCFITFFFVFFMEILGVKTGYIFGEYSYGNTLGLKIAEVPIIIGLNWLMLIYSAGVICNKLNTSSVIKSIIGAAMLVVLDFFMEPVAIKNDFWAWHNSIVPIQNYVAWFIAAFILLFFFYKMPFEKNNKLAIVLYCIQLAFFISLSIANYFNSHYVYLSLILFTLSYPLYKSFESRVHFYSKWKYLLPAIIISAIIFSVWDIYFAYIGIWEFNPDYVLGLFIINLPIEEWLFFIVIPFSCIFIYEVMNYFVKKDVLAKQSKQITNLLAIALLLTAMVYNHRLHTFVTFLSMSIFLFFHQYVLKSNYLGRYYIAWIVCMLPFLIVNGILTAMPVIIYNPLEIIGVRILTIPIEDVFYGMLLYLLVLTIYERLKNKDTKIVS